MLETPIIATDQSWLALFDGSHDTTLAEAARQFLPRQRWFAGKARRITSVTLVDSAPCGRPPDAVALAIFEVAYADGGLERYFVPLAFAPDDARRPALSGSAAALARVPGGTAGTVIDAVPDDQACRTLVAAMLEAPTVPMRHGAARFSVYEAGPEAPGGWRIVRTSGEQSNSCVIAGQRYILKLLRRLDAGPNPEVEISRHLSGLGFARVPRLAAILEYDVRGRDLTSLAVLQQFVPNLGTGWDHAVADVRNSFEQPDRIESMPYLASAATLGRRTAELHLALAHETDDPAFAPEAFTPQDLAARSAGLQQEATRTFALLAERLDALPAPARDVARTVRSGEAALIARLGVLATLPLTSTRTRVHGDYHLGQVLRVGDDFVIIDFEGEPARSLSERRAKQSPLKDVAGMLRSFGYAAYSTLLTESAGRRDRFEQLEPIARRWEAACSAVFLAEYRRTAAGASSVPRETDAFYTLLDLFILEKALYELAYELGSRPAWVEIPLLAIVRLIDVAESSPDRP
jgi:maltose alpha-D-glucosyltransferase/alpha-amylase